MQFANSSLFTTLCHLAGSKSLLKCKSDRVIHLLSIFNTSFVNVKQIYIVSLGWYHLASAYISSIHASYLKFLYFTHIFHNCPIHCFHTFIHFFCTVPLPEISAQFLTQASKLSSSLHVLSEHSVYLCHEIYLNALLQMLVCLFTCISPGNMQESSRGKSLA